MDHPQTDALQIVHRLRDGAVRVVFRSLIRDEDRHAMDSLASALGPRARLLNLGDPVFREELLEALEYRISPPDEQDTGPLRPLADATFAFERLAA